MTGDRFVSYFHHHILACLLQQVVVQLDNAVAECKAFVLDCVEDLTHAVKSLGEKTGKIV